MFLLLGVLCVFAVQISFGDLVIQVIDHSFDTVLHQNHIPVEQEAELTVTQFEISQQLGLMDG